MSSNPEDESKRVGQVDSVGALDHEEVSEWDRLREYLPFALRRSDDSIYSAQLDVAETALINSIKICGIEWTHDSLSYLFKNPIESPFISVNDDDDRVSTIRLPLPVHSKTVHQKDYGVFEFFITSSPKIKDYRVHVFNFFLDDSESTSVPLSGVTIAPVAVGRAKVQRVVKTLGKVPLPRVRVLTTPMDATRSVDAGFFRLGGRVRGWVTQQVGVVSNRIVTHSTRAAKDLLNLIATNARSEGKREIISLSKETTKKTIKRAFDLATTYLTDWLQ